MSRVVRRSLLLGAFATLAAACADDGPGDAAPERATSSGVELVVDVIAGGLGAPTQLTVDADGWIVVAELNGGERDGTGRVLRFDPDRPDEREVLVDGLLVPTGLAIDGDLLWIMEQRRLTVGPYDDPGDRSIVLDELPFNGRSQGTLTAVAGGGVLYNTSGARDGDRLVEGSGSLWFLADPSASPEPIATGFKHAYAHAPLDGRRWLVSEISDGMFNGGPPPDELLIVEPGDDFGFPRCIGDGEPVTAFDVPAEECAAAPSSLALFEPRATPTSVAIAPWDPTTALVALWTQDAIVAVPTEPGDGPHEPSGVAVDVGRPQHLHVDGTRVLVTDHISGRVLAIEPVSRTGS